MQHSLLSIYSQWIVGHRLQVPHRLSARYMCHLHSQPPSYSSKKLRQRCMQTGLLQEGGPSMQATPCQRRAAAGEDLRDMQHITKCDGS